MKWVSQIRKVNMIIHRAFFRGLVLLTLISASLTNITVSSAKECPVGYRLHYQGFCIHIKDELSDTLEGLVRGTKPVYFPAASKSGNQPIGYKFSNMQDGKFCKNAYLKLLRGLVLNPAAMALGDQSCGISSFVSVSSTAAKSEALKTCLAVTSNCRIIFPLVLD